MSNKKKSWQKATTEEIKNEISRLGKLASYFSQKRAGRLIMEQAELMRILISRKTEAPLS